MKARITNSPYTEIPSGTIGDIMGRDENKAAIKVSGRFYVQGGRYEETTKTLAFQNNEFEEIPDLAAPQGPEIPLVQSLEWLAEQAHSNARDKGFWKLRDELVAAATGVSPELAAFAKKCVASQLRELMISEISEACEGDRKDLVDTHIPHFSMVEAEMADLLIRLADYCKAYKLRLGAALISKMDYNSKRPQMHGGKAF